MMTELNSSSSPARACAGEAAARLDSAVAMFTGSSRQLKVATDHRNVVPTNSKDDRTPDEGDECQAKQESTVPLHVNAQNGDVTDNCPSHHAHRQNGSH